MPYDNTSCGVGQIFGLSNQAIPIHFTGSVFSPSTSSDFAQLDANRTAAAPFQLLRFHRHDPSAWPPAVLHLDDKLLIRREYESGHPRLRQKLLDPHGRAAEIFN